MKNNQKEINESFEKLMTEEEIQKWERGDLGCDPEHVVKPSPEEALELSNAFVECRRNRNNRQSNNG